LPSSSLSTAGVLRSLHGPGGPAGDEVMPRTQERAVSTVFQYSLELVLVLVGIYSSYHAVQILFEDRPNTARHPK
jgi:hypothetical protein